MTSQFRRALDRNPASLRALARESGVSHVTLIRIRDGDFGLTPDIRQKLVKAFRSWSRLCADLADRLEKEGSR